MNFKDRLLHPLFYNQNNFVNNHNNIFNIKVFYNFVLYLFIIITILFTYKLLYIVNTEKKQKYFNIYKKKYIL